MPLDFLVMYVGVELLGVGILTINIRRVFLLLILFFEMGFLCVVLVILVLVWTSGLQVPSPRIKGVCHHRQAQKSLL